MAEDKKPAQVKIVAKRKRAAPLPPEVKDSKVVKTRKLSKKTVQKFLDDMMLTFTPSMTFELLRGIRQNLINGDPQTQKMMMQVLYGVVPGGGGPNVNIINQNVNTQVSSDDAYNRTIDSIVRKLDEQQNPVIDVKPR